MFAAKGRTSTHAKLKAEIEAEQAKPAARPEAVPEPEPEQGDQEAETLDDDAFKIVPALREVTEIILRQQAGRWIKSYC